MNRSDIEAAIIAAEAKVAKLDARRAEAVERLQVLRRQLAAVAPEGGATGWSASRKLALFRSLFRGREDVFAVRWERPTTGRSGYAPKCANEWKPGVCNKPRVRCAACANQAFVRVSERVVRDHLQGRIVMGIYPLLADDTCWLLAIDLDGESWPEDVAALRAACRELDLVPAIERSSSGRGAGLAARAAVVADGRMAPAAPGCCHARNSWRQGSLGSTRGEPGPIHAARRSGARLRT
jgi:hypothetical protein